MILQIKVSHFSLSLSLTDEKRVVFIPWTALYSALRVTQYGTDRTSTPEHRISLSLLKIIMIPRRLFIIVICINNNVIDIVIVIENVI